MKKYKFLLIICLLPLLFACGKKNDKITSKRKDKTDGTITQKQDVYYDIAFVDYDNTLLYQTRVKEGEIPSYSMSNPTRDNDEDYLYAFSGWTPELSAATSNTTYTANYNRTELPYTISFNLDGGTSTDTIKTIKTDKLNKDLFSFNLKKSGYSFKGWSYNNQIVFDGKGNLVNDPIMSSNMTFKAEFEEAVLLTVTYSLYNPKSNELIETYTELQDSFGNISETKEYKWNTYVDLFAELNEGYSFIGWYSDGMPLSDQTSYKHTVWEEDVTIEARIRYSTYILNVWSNTPDLGNKIMIREGNTNTYYDEQTKEEHYTEKISIAAYTETSDIRFLGWYDSNNALISTDAIYTFDMPNNDYTLEAKWNSFKITYDLDGGTNDPNNPTVYDIDMDNIQLLVPIKEYYIFMGWYCNNELITEINTQNACNINIEVHWEESDIIKELANYYFTINEGNFTITGVKDKSITNLIVPSSVVSIELGAFSGCSNLISITIPFVGDKAHTLTDRYQYPFGYVFGTNSYAGGIVITQYYIVSNTSNTTYANYYFPAKLREVIITGSTQIQYGAFYGCNNLTSVTIPNSVTNIGDKAFYECRGLASVRIPNSVISIGYSAFYNCSSLVSVILSNTLTTMCDEAFYGCKALISIDIPGSVVGIGASAFYECRCLENATIQNGVTIIGGSAFYCCVNLTSVTIPNSVTSIGGSAFYYSGLTDIILPNSVTKIEPFTFYGCNNLASVTIPNSVTSIGGSAFDSCSKLKTVFYEGTSSQWSSISISGNNASLTNATCYYYSEDEPEETGNYWHYVDSVPTVWE